MAEFILNSTERKALRKSEVIAYQIDPFERQGDEQTETGFNLVVKMSRNYDPDIIFETAETLEDLQPLVNAFHAAMES